VEACPAMHGASAGQHQLEYFRDHDHDHETRSTASELGVKFNSVVLAQKPV
jgi:hypothetical protein